MRRGLACLRTVADLKGVPLWLQGKGDMAGIVLYAAHVRAGRGQLDLWHPPPSHRQGPIFLNVRRVLDMPQAVALVFPRKVYLWEKDKSTAKAWEWPLQLATILGGDRLKIITVRD